jgi:hypothetical protein
MLRTKTPQEWATALSYNEPVIDATWPSEFDDPPRQLSDLSNCYADAVVETPCLVLATALELNMWVTHYGTLYLPRNVRLFLKIWSAILQLHFDVPPLMAAPLDELLPSAHFRKFIGRRSLREFNTAPPPPYESWDALIKELHPLVFCHLTALFGR